MESLGYCGLLLQDVRSSGPAARDRRARTNEAYEVILMDEVKYVLAAKKDVLLVLSAFTAAEVRELRRLLRAGEIDGSVYVDGHGYGCLLSTLARIRGCRYDEIPGVEIDYRRPAERWFRDILPGDTPRNSTPARHALLWINESLLGRVEV